MRRLLINLSQFEESRGGAEYRSATAWGAVDAVGRWVIVCLLMVMGLTSPSFAQRRVEFPPAESKPPPPVKEPPRTISSGEDTSLLPDPGPSMRKTQERTPPPPTNLTVMYKIEYGETLEYIHPDGTVQKFEQWKSYPSDAANLVSFTNQRLADGNNYQYATKPLASDGFDPVDIPILFMAGDYDFVFTDAEVEHLRKFLADGGTIIFNAARGREEFSRAVAREMRKVFPQKMFMKLALDHPIFNARYRVQQVMMQINGVQVQQPPEVYSIDIGTRAAAILVPGGMGAAWSLTEYHPAGKHLTGESAIRLGVNLIAYVLGSTEYGRFLAQEFPVYSGQTRAGDAVKCATIQYSGSWDDNPTIQNTMMHGLSDNTGITVDYAPHPIGLDDPNLGRFPITFMTGHHDFRLTPEEAKGLANYVQRGGILVASASAGFKPFDVAFRRELNKAFPNSQLIKLPPTHALFTGGWIALDRITYTPAALKDNPQLEYPEFYGLFIEDRLAVIYTPLDLMSGVNRESNAYAKGPAPDDALREVIDIITYALSH